MRFGSTLQFIYATLFTKIQDASFVVALGRQASILGRPNVRQIKLSKEKWWRKQWMFARIKGASQSRKNMGTQKLWLATGVLHGDSPGKNFWISQSLAGASVASHCFSCTQYFTCLAFLCSNIYLPWPEDTAHLQPLDGEKKGQLFAHIAFELQLG